MFSDRTVQYYTYLTSGSVLLSFMSDVGYDF